MARALARTALVLVLAPACQERKQTDWKGVEIQSEAICDDGVDNDADGAFDCDDPDCVSGCFGENRPPLAPEVSIRPASPTTEDELVCSAVATDPEGDPLTYEYSWWMDGAFAAEGPVLGSELTVGYDTWVCRAIPSDGQSEGSAAEASVAIEADNRCVGLDYAVNDRVVVPRFAEQDLVGTDFTLEAWVYVDGGYVETQLPILTSDPQPDLSGWRFGVVGPPGLRTLRFQLGGGLPNLPMVESVTLVPEERWAHVAVTWESATREARLFIDGSRVIEQPMADEPLAGASVADLVLGGSDVGGNLWMVGRLDEVRISTEVRYGPDFLPRVWFEPDPGTLALWHLDDAVGGWATEEVAARDGLLTGASWTSSSACDTLP